MTRRQLLAGVAITAVLGAVFWYVAVAPSSGNSVAPDTSVRVALSATAAGSGSWVRYLITVKNLADGDFSGNVLLVDQDQDTEAAGAKAPSLGSLSQNPQIPTVPAIAGESAYQVHVTVASRTSRTVAVLAPDFFNVVEAIMGGSLLDAETVDRAAVLPVAVVSGAPGPVNAVLGLRFDTFNTRVAEFGSAREMPTSPLQLAGYMVVAIDQFDTGALSRAQVGALRDFVGFGGTLVVAGGPDWRQTLAPLPADLLPIRPAGTATLSLDPLARLAGIPAIGRSAPVAVGTLAPGARTLLDGDGGVPLAAELSYGAGRVVELAYDPSGQGTAGTPYAALGWSQALGRGIAQPPGTAPMATSLLGPDAGVTGLLPSAGDAPLPSLGLMAAVLLLYVLITGPLGYLLVRRRWGRPGLFWAAVPLVAVVFTAGFYLVGSSLQGSLEDHEIQVLRVAPGRAVDVLEYHRILFLRRGNHQIQPAANTLVAPLTLETYRTTGSTCERCTDQLAGLPSGAEHAIPGPQPTVDESGVVYGSVRVVASTEVTSLPLGLDSQLTLRGGRIQGTVANGGRLPVADLVLFTNDGQGMHRADLATLVPPGARATVDGKLVAADAPGQGLTPEDALLRSVAASSLTARGQVVLIGLTLPLSSGLQVDGAPPPRGAALAVMEQPVTLTGADTSIRDVQQKRLASATGDPTSGFSDAYDLTVPSGGTPLTLTYDPQGVASIEVYDWSRDVFVPQVGVPGSSVTASTIPLTGAQVHDGLVRVRLHEAHVSWAADLWLDAPGG